MYFGSAKETQISASLSSKHACDYSLSLSLPLSVCLSASLSMPLSVSASLDISLSLPAACVARELICDTQGNTNGADQANARVGARSAPQS